MVHVQPDWLYFYKYNQERIFVYKQHYRLSTVLVLLELFHDDL